MSLNHVQPHLHHPRDRSIVPPILLGFPSSRPNPLRSSIALLCFPSLSLSHTRCPLTQRQPYSFKTQVTPFDKDQAHTQIADILAHRPSIKVQTTDILSTTKDDQPRESAVITFKADSEEMAQDLKSAFEKNQVSCRDVTSKGTTVRGRMGMKRDLCNRIFICFTFAWGFFSLLSCLGC